MADITIIMGDITFEKVDAIVNAANTGMLGGGGVDGAIHRAAGPELYDECIKIPAGPNGRCPTGEARMTGAGRLTTCKKVIHTAGPVYRNGKSGESDLLASCYRNSLLTAENAGLESIAFPNISTGIYGYPKKEAAEIAVKTVKETLQQTKSIKRVVFVCFDRENYELYEKLL